MIPELGHYALMLALGLALIQGTIPIVGARTNDPVLMSIAAPTAVAHFFFVAIAFGALVECYVTSDFSVANVYENSNSAMPLIYRLTSVWGNHEGSMMLWVSILAFFGALVAVFGTNLPVVLKANALAVQAWIAAAFHLFILTTSNPFLRIIDAPFEGQDLNPILQDPGLAFHPPMLYLGYVGFSIAFSFAIAALLEGRVDAAWARWVRPWVLGAWMCLTLGIAGGSYWAYYELGWGGFWFWDPVENASLMPWLAGTALLHSAVVMEKRGALKVWTILLAILTFSLSLIGTFLVRSGVLTSVHAFAVDPTRGIFILAILVVFIGGALALYAWRAPLLKQGGLFAPISREGALVFNNLFLTSACATVFVGTLYPLALQALTGAKISVGPPFFNSTFGPLFIPLVLAMSFGPLLAWKRGDLVGAAQRLLFAALLCAVAIAAAFALEHGGPVLAPFGVGIAVFVMAGAVTDIAERTMILRLPFRAALQRAIGLPRSAWGTAFAHFGIGVTLLGIVAVTAWGSERIAAIKVGDTLDISHYRLTFDGVFNRGGPNYHDVVGHFTVRRASGELIGALEPSRRTFPARNMATTEAALMSRGFSQIYVSLGDPNPDGTVPVRLFFKPQVLMIWFGAIIMFFGGALSLSDRRLRVGAPRPAKAKAALQAAE
ncbi:MAG TPA: heme lyase CcmF/NrfE family subunit [Xanthobacteraceae bacterium]|nr:heme lyase CcmF/NrfE family subunit [Xanthobacteraceae bacterium]